MADTRPIIQGPQSELNKQYQDRLSALLTDVDRISILVDDRGATGDGSTEDTTAIQDAIDEANGHGGGAIRFTPGKSYVTKCLFMRSNVNVDLNRATLLAKSGTNNELFAFGANPTTGGGGLTPISLSSAVQGATSITVSSSSSFVVGERIMISAGTFTGSGSEEGPIEFNTVTAKPDGTHITVKTPLKYTYSAFGLPGAAGAGVYRMEASGGSYTRGLIQNVRISNGIIKPASGFDGVYFNGSGENLEVDHILMDGFGTNITTGGYISGLLFHHNVMRGAAAAASGGFNFASLVDSWITDNNFNRSDDSSTNNRNGLELEVTCRDNVIAHNLFGPHRSTSGGAIEISKYGFNNRIVFNRIIGIASDVTGGTATIGIRTYANSSSMPAGLGNVIVGNHITDIMQAIGDIGPASIIFDNTLVNTTSHANSQGIIGNNDKGVIGFNQISGFTNPFWDGASAVQRVQSLIGDRGFIFGQGSPESVVTAPVGMLYVRRDGGAGISLYVKESGTGNTGWKAVTTAGVIGSSVQAWDADLDAIAALSPSNDDIIQRKSGAWTNRTISQLKTDLDLNSIQDVSYSSGNFSAATGSWTVDSGDQTYWWYQIIDGLMTVGICIVTSTLSAGTANISVPVPAGKTATRRVLGVTEIRDNGTYGYGAFDVQSGTIYFYASPFGAGASWAASSNNTNVAALIQIPI